MMKIGIDQSMGEAQATGKVVRALGNLLYIAFEGTICQGEVCWVRVSPDVDLQAEVIEISNGIAKIQVFESTEGIAFETPVFFSGHLLEAELGPGLLNAVVDGLQNPLNRLADLSGLLLARGVYVPALDRRRCWDFHPTAQLGELLAPGDSIGFVMEGRFKHEIMIPFALSGRWRLTDLKSEGSFTIEMAVATIVNELGEERPVTMMQRWPIKKPLLVGSRTRPEKMLETGIRIIDTQFPLLKGGTFCTPGPFGAGKTVLQHHLARYASADIVIMVACGERAGEVVEVLQTFPHLSDPHTEAPLMERTLVVCNTSSMPVASRESSLYLGVTVAEYYRQMGYDVLLIADSTSRWAQALREMSGRLEEIPGEDAFPANLYSKLAGFYERAGALLLKNQKTGSLTIGGAVSPAGGNIEEPVTQGTLACVGAFLGLSRERSDSRRYPAIDPIISWSKYVAAVGRLLEAKRPGWSVGVQQMSELVRKGDEIAKRMEVVGEQGVSLAHFVAYLKSELFESCYLQQNAFDEEDKCSGFERQVHVFSLVEKMLRSTLPVRSAEEARTLFLKLQSSWKTMNASSFLSAVYNEAYQSIDAIFSRPIHGSEFESEPLSLGAL